MRKKFYIFVVMLISIVSMSFVSVKVFASNEVSTTELTTMANYIGDHLNEFKSAYNSNNDKPLKANRIDKYCMAYIIDAKEYGICIDFDGDNGYIVSTLSYDLYAVETEGDLDYLNDIDLVYYSVVDGLLYYDGTNYHKMSELTTHGQRREFMYGYNGQYESGEAGIYDIDKYMADRYPSYKLEENHNIASKAYTVNFTMLELSVYVKRRSDDGGQNYIYVQSESNCALTSAFSVMSSWGETGYFPNMPSRTTYKTDFVSNWLPKDKFYDTYGTGTGGPGIESYWSLNEEVYLNKMPELYFWTRDYAISGNNYAPERGMTTEETKYTFQNVTNHYTSFNFMNTSTNFADVMSALDQGHAVFMGIANSQYYGGDHAVALYGYRKYSYTTGAWIFTQHHTAYFFIIDDGHEKALTYFDPNCNSKLSYEFIYAR